MRKKLHNTGATEVVYDLVGHVVASGETVVVESPDSRTNALIKSGKLVELKERLKEPKADGDKNGDKK